VNNPHQVGGRESGSSLPLHARLDGV